MQAIGEYTDKELECPNCGKSVEKTHNDAGFPVAECTECSWGEGIQFLVRNDFYDAERGVE